MKTKILIAISIMCATVLVAQQPRIPASHKNLAYDNNGKLYFELEGKKYFAEEVPV